jgi:hypothetical protein
MAANDWPTGNIKGGPDRAPSRKEPDCSDRIKSGKRYSYPGCYSRAIAVEEVKPEATATTIPSLFRQTTQTGDTQPVAELGKPEQRQVNITLGQFESMRLEVACQEDKKYARPDSAGSGNTGLRQGRSEGDSKHEV